jgi:hypothetical protein
MIKRGERTVSAASGALGIPVKALFASALILAASALASSDTITFSGSDRLSASILGEPTDVGKVDAELVGEVGSDCEVSLMSPDEINDRQVPTVVAASIRKARAGLSPAKITKSNQGGGCIANVIWYLYSEQDQHKSSLLQKEC